MCIMEVRAGQHNTTIAQALAHNLYTSIGDLEMFITKLSAENDTNTVHLVTHELDNVKRAYAGMLAVFGMELAEHFHGPHQHDENVGNERTFIEQAHHDATLARRYETR